jgi:branched-chain amino acid transport system substrate-binding protein
MKRTAFIAAAGSVAAVPSFAAATFAAGATVRIGLLDSYSGVFSDIAGYQKLGAQIALDEANARGRVKYEFVFGDDASSPQIGTTEARRLIDQEKVDVLMHGTSSAVALAIAPLALDAGIFTLFIGAQDSSLAGSKATATAYRLAPDVQMFTKALTRRILSGGKRWYFIVADYAFGRDGYNRLSTILRNAGGTEVGADFLKLGTPDFSSTLTKIRDTPTDQIVLCQAGLDVAVCAKQFVDLGLNRTIRLAGMTLEDFYYKTLPLDALAGSVFAVLWSPNVSDSAKRVAHTIAQRVGPFVSLRHYLGYLATKQMIDRIEAAGSTETVKLAAAFHDHAFDAYKNQPAIWRGCDHQALQNVYAGSLVNAAHFAKTNTLFDVVGEVATAESNSPCGTGEAAQAAAAIATQKIPDRAFKTV